MQLSKVQYLSDEAGKPTGVILILSIAEYMDVKQGDGHKSIEEFEAANVLFMKDHRTTYIEKMFVAILR